MVLAYLLLRWWRSRRVRRILPVDPSHSESSTFRLFGGGSLALAFAGEAIVSPLTCNKLNCYLLVLMGRLPGNGQWKVRTSDLAKTAADVSVSR